MKNTIYLFISIFCLTIGLKSFGQKNLVYNTVQDAKRNNINFKYISNAFISEGQEPKILDQFIEPNEVSFLSIIQ